MNNKLDILIKKGKKIKDAISKLDKTAGKVLYVIDENDKLKGSISDGDIRRGLIRGLTLENLVDEIMFEEVQTIKKSDIRNKKLLNALFREGYLSVPVVNANGEIEDIIFSDYVKPYFECTEVEACSVFILAGGIGSRLEPFTKVLPKPLVPLGDIPIIEMIMSKFHNYGFSNFIVSVNYKADMIKLYLNDSNVRSKFSNISFVREETPLGTIGSLELAKELITDDFYISNSDIIVEDNLKQIYKYHKAQDNMLTIVSCEKKSVIPYGVLDIDESGLLRGINEKPSFDFFVNTGLYVAKKGILKYLNSGEPKDMNELIYQILDDGGRIGVYKVDESSWFDIGQWSVFESTRKHFESNYS